ncbi:MAG: T9SS type A sorting domain-containing protein [Bacteroidetes bacterium]|nr:T9SS type A sorting domain-containing protein [Bacteroidota bacterium]
MKKYFYLLIGVLSIAQLAIAQKEAWNWYFGNTCALNFSTGAPLPLFNSIMNQYEGSSSISDATGNLLFYTDGVIVVDSTHAIMPNGTGLMGNSSANQSALIIPNPGNPSKYYLFSNSTFSLYFSEVDMTLNGGKGDVVLATKNTLVNPSCSEKLAGVKHANGVDFWVMVHGTGNSTFYAYLVSAAGVTLTPVTTSIGIVDIGAIGQMQFSPDGKKCAFGTYGGTNNCGIFDFDAATGIVSNPIDIPVSNQVYGLSFSPNSRFLYRGHNPFGSAIYQYDCNAGSAAAVIASEVLVGSGFSNDEGHLQIGPDNKVYLARDGLSNLGVIEYPDSPGVACGFNAVGPSLGGKFCGLGLPNFQSAFFNNNAQIENFCLGDTTTFVVSDSVILAAVSWNFGDPGSGPLNTSFNYSAAHYYSAAGTYNVQLIVVYLNLSIDTLVYPITIYPAPQPNLGPDSTLCIGQSYMLDPGAFNTYLWSNGSTAGNITTLNSGTYTVTVTDINGCKSADSVALIYTACANVIVNIAANDSLFCDKNCIDFTDLTQNSPYSWMWYFTGASPATSTDQNPQNICYNNYGTFDVTLVACNNVGCDSVVFPAFITEFQLPVAPVATLNNNVLSSTSAFSYQWFIVGDTTVYSTAQTYTPTVSGNYYVLIADSNGCQVPSNVVGFYLGISQLNQSDMVLFPNPAGNSLYIQTGVVTNSAITITIYDASGRIVYNQQQLLQGVNGQLKIDLKNISSGLYTLEVVQKNSVARVKFAKE